ncbi:cupin domain-containing protein [Avibacterium volantium]|uniref:cupin domain-containing protein n=1 Tax=Avibacterium TaxID=292486 RepID=UPI003BF8490A
MDALDHLIELAQIKGEIHTHCLFQGNWRAYQPSAVQNMGVFHIISRGECQLFMQDQTLHLQEGDLIFLPSGDEHYIQSKDFQQAHAKQIEKTDEEKQAWQLATNVVSQADFEMFCGAFYYDKQSILFKILPHFLHLSTRTPSLEKLIDLFRLEIAQNKKQLGGKSVINALCTVLFCDILRQYMQDKTAQMGLLAGLQDKKLAPVIEHILEKPAFDWNMENLAQLANMSRANFIRVFQKIMAITPGKFLTQIRMQQASMLLKSTQKNILAIALDIGYQSEAYFSRAFKQHYGISPNRYRKGEQENKSNNA